MDKLLPCPCGLNGGYVSQWTEQERNLFCKVAQVRCNCGWSAPIRYGDNCVEDAIRIWNTRINNEAMQAATLDGW